MRTPTSPTRRRRRTRACVGLAALAAAVPLAAPLPSASAQDATPAMVDPDLVVRPFVTGIARPVSMAFLPDGSAFVLEKSTGKVQHVRDGAVVATVLDLPVNSNTAAQSERGLLGVALHPRFPQDPGVYLYWSESSVPGVDSQLPQDSPVLGNRVDRFRWTGLELVHEKELLRLRSRRDDEPVQKAGHIGGVLRFGPDGRLYVVTGDVGRRGLTQNLLCGPTPSCPPVADDAYGGPFPDDEHLTGVVLRLEDDGRAPRDNPFWLLGRLVGGEAGANLQKVYAYGIRNSFGMAFDPVSGALWDQENGEDAFDELNRVEAGSNSGWVQVMGPLARYQDWRRIETVERPAGAGELRWPTANMAPTAAQAFLRLVHLPGSRYSDPEFSWQYSYPPAGIGFVQGDGLGAHYRDDLVVGAQRDGRLLRFELSSDRRRIEVSDPRLADRVADNTFEDRTLEGECLVFGSGFGVVTDVQTGPDGRLYVVDHTRATVWQIAQRGVG